MRRARRTSRTSRTRSTWRRRRSRTAATTTSTAARRKVRDSAEREMAQLRKRADAELDRLEQVWDRFKNLKVADLEGDEMLYRALQDRYGTYFEGSMGATAIQK